MCIRDSLRTLHPAECSSRDTCAELSVGASGDHTLTGAGLVLAGIAVPCQGRCQQRRRSSRRRSHPDLHGGSRYNSFRVALIRRRSATRGSTRTPRDDPENTIPTTIPCTRASPFSTWYIAVFTAGDGVTTVSGMLTTYEMSSIDELYSPSYRSLSRRYYSPSKDKKSR